jgi:bacillithiol biosynthesis deacetylase BshB1
MTTADVLVFGAHPDDIEIGCGGTVRKLVERGHRVVLVDLSRGELGTRGDAAIRASEAEAALRVLGAHARENLDLPDGAIKATPEAAHRVADAVRRWRPRLVIAPYWEARHPDHANASRLCYEGAFLAGLEKVPGEHPAFRPSQLVYYGELDAMTPSFVVDITRQYETKMQAIRAFATQFVLEASEDPPTRLTGAQMRWRLETAMRHLGAKIGVAYGEGFLIHGTQEVDDPLQLRFTSF